MAGQQSRWNVRPAFAVLAFAFLAAGVLHPAWAQENKAPENKAPERPAETVDGPPGVTLKLVPPAGLCRVDAQEDREAFQAMSRLMSGKVLALWLSCPDLARHRAGEDTDPARWMYVIAQRDGRGEVRPMRGVTRQEAFARWADAWKREADARLAKVKQKLQSELELDADMGKPQLFGPDGTAIYLALPGQIRDAGAAQPTRIASVSGWSMFFDYRIGVSLSEKGAGAERFDPLRAEVRDAMLSLDHLSVATGGR